MKTDSIVSVSKGPTSRRPKLAKKKQRCWSFVVTGINRNGPEKKKSDVLASFRERYTAVKKLTLSPARGPDTGNINTWEGVRAVVQFIGPQPSQGPGTLLRQLLSGTSVEAVPIILGRGRKPRSDCESSGTSDYDLDDSGRGTPYLGLTGKSTNLACDNINTIFGDHLGPDQRAEILLPSRELHPLPLRKLFRSSKGARVMPPITHTVESSKGMQWDEVVRRVEPPPRQRGLPAPQHSLDLGGLYVSSDSEDDISCAFAGSDDGELVSQPIFNEIHKTNPWHSGDLKDETPGAVPFFKRLDNINEFSTASGRSILGSTSQYSEQIDVEGVSQQNNVPRTPAIDKFSLSTDFGSSLSMRQQDSIDTRAVSFEGGLTQMNLFGASQIVEPLQGVSIQSVLMPQECDFDGMPAPVATARNSTPGSIFQTSGGFNLSFTGLECVGKSLHDLEATAYFRAGTGPEVSSVAGPIQQGPMNRAYATLFYPSMLEIWPEVYGSASIRTVQVEVCVQVRSTDGSFSYVEPDLKVTYRRALIPDEDII